METNKLDRPDLSPVKLLSDVSDLDIERCLSAVLSKALMQATNVTIVETNRWQRAQKITFEINSLDTPAAVQAVRGFSDADLERVLETGLGQLTSREFTVTVRRRSYSQSYRPARMGLEPIRLSVFIEATNRDGEFDLRRKTA